MNVNQIEFRDPPTKLGRRARGAEFLRILALRPGEWAVYEDKMKAGTCRVYASNYRKLFPEAEWVSRQEGETWTLFVRYIKKPG